MPIFWIVSVGRCFAEAVLRFGMGLLSRGDGGEGEGADVDDPANRQYQYKVETNSFASRKSTKETKFNKLDAEGWVYVDSFLTNGSTTAAVFRRPYPDAEGGDN